jgi:metallo-beta-lactamase family protein
VLDSLGGTPVDDSGRATRRGCYNVNMTVIPSQPRLSFLGAAQFVTGSMHLLEADGRRILLDCGIVLGRSAATLERNRRFPFAPASIDAVLVSHAHIDHCGNLPNLVAQGFAGPIYCTPATRDLMAIMLSDSARIQDEQAEVGRIIGPSDECSTGSLYSGHEVQLALDRCVAEPYDRTFHLAPGITARFADAGHLLGSAMTQVTIDGAGREHTLTYTGDLGRPALHFLCPPAPLPASDIIVSESTYGARIHQSVADLARKLQDLVRRTVERGGKVLIPAFNLGRSQLVVHYIQHWMRRGELPNVPLFMDSPLAADITEIHRLYPELLAEPFRHEVANPLARYIRDARESRELGTRRGPCILVASGGMCEAGRIVNHLERNVDDPRCTIVLVSYQAPGSLGRKLMDKGPTVRFRGRAWNKWAEVVDLNGFSGHADQRDLRDYFAPLHERQPRVCLVHGEPDQAHALAAALGRDGLPDVTIPQRGDSMLLERERVPSA